MKVKELPILIAQEIDICAGIPQQNKWLSTYEVCTYGPFDYPNDCAYGSYEEQTQKMWADVLKEFGECEVIAIEATEDEWNYTARLFIKEEP